MICLAFPREIPGRDARSSSEAEFRSMGAPAAGAVLLFQALLDPCGHIVDRPLGVRCSHLGLRKRFFRLLFSGFGRLGRLLLQVLVRCGRIAGGQKRQTCDHCYSEKTPLRGDEALAVHFLAPTLHTV